MLQVGDPSENGTNYEDALANCDAALRRLVARGLMAEREAKQKMLVLRDESDDWLLNGLRDKGINADDLEALAAACAEADTVARALDVVPARDAANAPGRAFGRELVGPLLVRGNRTLLAAHTGEGKTTFALQLIAAALHGDGFLGWKGEGDDLYGLYIDAEQSSATLSRRLREAGLESCENLHVIRAPDGLELDRDDSAETRALEARLSAGGYDLVILDPLYKAHRGDSNDERAATDLMRRLDAWRERYDFALLILTHCRKPAVGTRLSVHDVFGSSAYTRGAEVVVGLERIANGYSRLSIFKDRDGDLEVGSRLRLTFDREHGFQHEPEKRTATKSEKIAAALAEEPGLTKVELMLRTSSSEKTVERALSALGAISDGRKPAHYSLPQQGGGG